MIMREPSWEAYTGRGLCELTQGINNKFRGQKNFSYYYVNIPDGEGDAGKLHDFGLRNEKKMSKISSKVILAILITSLPTWHAHLK